MSFYLETLKFLKNLKKRIHFRLIRGEFQYLGSYLDTTIEIKNPQFISIGRGCSLRPFSWIFAVTGDRKQCDIFEPILQICDNCVIGRFCHITACNKIVIEESVNLGEGILISDGYHDYQDINTPAMYQPYVPLGPIIIGTGTWIGNGARIVGRVRVGRNCVIGTNTFVNKDVPDYCVVVGIPGRIVKRFDMVNKKWITVNEPLS